MNRVLTSWWFGEALVLALCVVVLLLAVVMTPSDGMLSLLGIEVPVMCTLRRFLGTDCPGCGLTRSFVYLAHADPSSAFRMNMLGPPLFLYTAIQIPYRIFRIRRGQPAKNPESDA